VNSAISKTFSIAGQMGLDINDVRTVFPRLDSIADALREQDH